MVGKGNKEIQRRVTTKMRQPGLAAQLAGAEKRKALESDG